MAITLLPIRLYFHNQAYDMRPNYSHDTIMMGFRGNNHTSECGNTFIGCHTTTLMLSPRPTKVLVSSLRNIKTILCPWRPDNWVEQPKTRKAKHPTRQIIALFVPSYDNFIPRTYWVNKMSPEALAGLSNGNAPPPRLAPTSPGLPVCTKQSTA